MAITQLQTILLGMKEPGTIHCCLFGVRFVQNSTATAVDFLGKCVEVTHSFSSIKIPSSGSIPVVLLSLPPVFPGVTCLWCHCDRHGDKLAMFGYRGSSSSTPGWLTAGIWLDRSSGALERSCCHHPAPQPSVWMHSLHAHVVCTHGNVVQKYSGAVWGPEF